MKSAACFIASFFCVLLSAQEIPHPVYMKINHKGKVVPVTADPYATSPRIEISTGADSLHYAILSTCPNNGRTDSARETRTGTTADFDVMYRTNQRELSTQMFYPEIMHPNWGVREMSFIDTLTTYDYSVDGYVCSNGGHYHYNMHEDWIYRPDGSLKTIITHNPYYSDTNSVVYNYEWHSSGKLKAVTVISSLFLYEEWRRDTLTMEMVYDTKDRLIAQVAYEGGQMDSLTVSVREWQEHLKQTAVHHAELENPVDHNGVESLFLITYTYENNQLTSSLGYNAAYSLIIADTLEYNRKGQVTRYVTHSDDGYLEITYLYNKKGQVISKKELQYYRDYEGSIRIDGEITETYVYDSNKRVSEVHYFWPDAQYPNTVQVNITYP
jgi:hypothetical protein